MVIHAVRPERLDAERLVLSGPAAVALRDDPAVDEALAREPERRRRADILVLVPHRLPPAAQPAVDEPWSLPMDDVGYADRIAVLFCIGVWALLVTLCARAVLFG